MVYLDNYEDETKEELLERVYNLEEIVGQMKREYKVLLNILDVLATQKGGELRIPLDLIPEEPFQKKLYVETDKLKNELIYKFK